MQQQPTPGEGSNTKAPSVVVPPLVFPPTSTATAAAAAAAEQEEGPMAPPPTPVGSSSATAGAPGAGGVRSGNRANILDSLLEIDLDAAGGSGGGASGGSMPSAARTMMELKALEKMRNEINAITPVPSRKAAAAATGAAPASTNRSGNHPLFASSSLEQATAGFAAEAGELASFERMQHGGGGVGGGGAKKGRKAVLSTKARQRRMAGAEKEEAYLDRLSGRFARQSKRKERMERLRRMY